MKIRFILRHPGFSQDQATRYVAISGSMAEVGDWAIHDRKKMTKLSDNEWVFEVEFTTQALLSRDKLEYKFAIQDERDTSLRVWEHLENRKLDLVALRGLSTTTMDVINEWNVPAQNIKQGSSAQEIPVAEQQPPRQLDNQNRNSKKNKRKTKRKQQQQKQQQQQQKRLAQKEEQNATTVLVINEDGSLSTEAGPGNVNEAAPSAEKKKKSPQVKKEPKEAAHQESVIVVEDEQAHEKQPLLGDISAIQQRTIHIETEAAAAKKRSRRCCLFWCY